MRNQFGLFADDSHTPFRTFVGAIYVTAAIIDYTGGPLNFINMQGDLNVTGYTPTAVRVCHILTYLKSRPSFGKIGRQRSLAPSVLCCCASFHHPMPVA